MIEISHRIVGRVVCELTVSTSWVELLELLEKLSNFCEFPFELMVLISRTPSQDEKHNHMKVLVFRAKKRLKWN